jgi:hypothetical protein
VQFRASPQLNSTNIPCWDPKDLFKPKPRKFSFVSSTDEQCNKHKGFQSNEIRVNRDLPFALYT